MVGNGPLRREKRPINANGQSSGTGHPAMMEDKGPAKTSMSRSLSAPKSHNCKQKTQTNKTSLETIKTYFLKEKEPCLFVKKTKKNRVKTKPLCLFTKYATTLSPNVHFCNDIICPHISSTIKRPLAKDAGRSALNPSMKQKTEKHESL